MLIAQQQIILLINIKHLFPTKIKLSIWTSNKVFSISLMIQKLILLDT